MRNKTLELIISRATTSKFNIVAVKLTCAIKCFIKCNACSLMTPYPFGEISKDPTVIRRPGNIHRNSSGPCTLSTAPCILPQI